MPTLLLDLVHPADALFFHRPIRILHQAGWQVQIASRHKDVLLPLLDRLGHPHRPISRAGRGAPGLALELAARDIALIRMARRVRPAVLAGFGAVAASHAGRALGLPCLGFYDSDQARLQIRLALPFVSEWHVPASWIGPEAPGRTHRFLGLKELSYLHPDHFRPDPDLARQAGWDPSRRLAVLRTVSWQANHDLGKSGLSLEALRRLVQTLQQSHQVLISAEAGLPPDLQPLQYRGDLLAMHHLLAAADLYAGESLTMATEAVVLGTPALFIGDFELGYLRLLREAGLIRHLRDPSRDPVAEVQALAASDRESFRARRQALLAPMIDVGQYVAAAIQRVAEARRSG